MRNCAFCRCKNKVTLRRNSTIPACYENTAWQSLYSCGTIDQAVYFRCHQCLSPYGGSQQNNDHVEARSSILASTSLFTAPFRAIGNHRHEGCHASVGPSNLAAPNRSCRNPWSYAEACLLIDAAGRLRQIFRDTQRGLGSFIQIR